jgi:hypothetical protein
MKTKIGILSLFCASIFSLPLLAHHGGAAFESGKNLTIKGTVTEWFWANPHCLLKFDGKGEDGEVAHWVAETQAPANIIDFGWRKNSFKPGDQVTVTVRPVKNGQPVGAIVKVLLADGSTLVAGGAGTLNEEPTGNEFHLSGAPKK